MVPKNDFSTTYDMYGDMMYKIAYLYLGSADDAEDVMQDVFVKLITKAPKFKNEEHKKAWLIRATQNRCKDKLKASERGNVNIDDYSIPSQNNNVDTKIDIITEILKLPALYKSAIILYYYYDYSVSEIAKTLKISSSSVKMRLKRGREILKIELEDYHNETK